MTSTTSTTDLSIARILADGAAGHGRKAVVKGWVRTCRESKAGVVFVAVSDGSCFGTLQVVVPAECPDFEASRRLTTGCAVVARGELVPSQGKGQSVEMRAEGLELVGAVEDPDTYPIQPKPHSFEYLREVAHLRPRTNTFGAIGRVRHCLAMAIHRFFDRHGFFWIHTPIVTGSDCEGAGQMFKVSTLDLANLPRGADGLAHSERRLACAEPVGMLPSLVVVPGPQPRAGLHLDPGGL